MKKYLVLLSFTLLSVTLRAQTTAADTTIYTAAAIDPVYPGGTAAFYKFFRAYSYYPKQEKKDHIQGRVIAQFIVEKDGMLSNIKIMRTPSEGLGKEVLRVLAMCPKWIPAKQGGKDVRVLYTVALDFVLKN
jgi:TonB family protein